MILDSITLHDVALYSLIVFAGNVVVAIIIYVGLLKHVTRDDLTLPLVKHLIRFIGLAWGLVILVALVAGCSLVISLLIALWRLLFQL